MQILQRPRRGVFHLAGDEIDFDDTILIHRAHAAATDGRNAAGVQARLRTVLERDAGGHIVRLSAHAAAAARFHVGDLAGNQAVHQIEIVDHEIEHGGNVGATTAPWPHAPAIHLQRGILVIQQAAAVEDEALLMPHREHPVLNLGERNERIRFRQAGGNRLLDQHIGIRVEEPAHDRGMRDRRRTDADDIHFAQQLTPIGNRTHAMIDHGLTACLGARIGDGHQLYPRHARILVGVMTPERAVSDHGRTQFWSRTGKWLQLENP
jgi:hypothetical protein